MVAAVAVAVAAVRSAAAVHSVTASARLVLGRGRRDDSADDIVVVSSNGGAHGDVHRGRQCAAAANNDTADNDTADADGDGGGNDIVC